MFTAGPYGEFLVSSYRHETELQMHCKRLWTLNIAIKIWRRMVSWGYQRFGGTWHILPFPQSLQANVAIVSQIRPSLLAIHYSVIIPRTSWSRSNAVELQSRGASFGSRPDHWLSWAFRGFPRSLQANVGMVTAAFFQILSSSSAILPSCAI
jgi:hypothetical protein